MAATPEETWAHSLSNGAMSAYLNMLSTNIRIFSIDQRTALLQEASRRLGSTRENKS